MSRDICCCQNWGCCWHWVESQDTAQHPAMPRMPTPDNDLVPNGHVQRRRELVFAQPLLQTLA